MLPDYGLYLYETGYNKNVEFHFTDFIVYNISVMGSGSFTTMVELSAFNREFAASFDFNDKILELILSQTSKSNADYIRKCLYNAGAGFTLDLDDSINVIIEAKLGEKAINARETYVPFNIVAVKTRE